MTTRDAALPAVHAKALESHEAARLVPPEQRRVLALENPGLKGADSIPASLFPFNDEPPLRALGLLQEEVER
jgi:gentisate 1,2-dioxygenase